MASRGTLQLLIGSYKDLQGRQPMQIHPHPTLHKKTLQGAPVAPSVRTVGTARLRRETTGHVQGTTVVHYAGGVRVQEVRGEHDGRNEDHPLDYAGGIKDHGVRGAGAGHSVAPAAHPATATASEVVDALTPHAAAIAAGVDTALGTEAHARHPIHDTGTRHRPLQNTVDTEAKAERTCFVINF